MNSYDRTSNESEEIQEKIKEEKIKLALSNFYELSEKDFYPPEDRRYIQSGVRDIKGGDNFAEYCEDFYEEYGSEIFDD